MNLRRPRGPRSAGPILFLSLAVAALSTTACNRPPHSDAAEALAAGGVRAREIPKVRMCPIERREMVQVLETMTKIESEREIEVFPLSAGIVTALHAEEGDRVQKDAILAQLDDRDEVLALRDAEVALEESRNSADLVRLTTSETEARMKRADISAQQAERDYARNLKLYEMAETPSALSESALEASLLACEQARADHDLAAIAWNKSKLDEKAAATAVQRAKVTLDRAQIALSHCRIEAPFAGVIAERRIRAGDSASSGAAAFVLCDTENLRTIIRRPQEELTLFRGSGNGHGGPGLAVTATAEALPGYTFEGEVVRISPTIDRDSGQFRVTAKLPSEDAGGGAQLLPGMLVRLEIVTDRHPQALVVPKRALRREGDRRFLFVLDPPDGETEGDPEGNTEEEPEAIEGEGDEAATKLGESATPPETIPETPTETSETAAEETPPEPPKDTRRLRRVDVEEGFSDDDYVEVLPRLDDVLEEGDEVMLVGSRDLDDGDLVEVEVRESDTPADDGEEKEPTAEEDATPAETPEATPEGADATPVENPETDR